MISTSGIIKEVSSGHTVYRMNHQPGAIDFGKTGAQATETLRRQAHEAVSRVGAQLRLKTLVGTMVMGRECLGSFPKPRYDGARNKEKRQLVHDEIRTEVEEERYSKRVSMSKLGA